MSKRIKTVAILALLLLLTAIIPSCDSEDDEEEGNPSSLVKTSFTKEAVIKGVREAEGSTTLQELFSDKLVFSNVKKRVTGKTLLLVLPCLKKEYNAEVKQTLDNGGEVAVTFPKEEEVASYFFENEKEINASYYNSVDYDETDYLLSFNRVGYHIVHSINDTAGPGVTLNELQSRYKGKMEEKGFIFYDYDKGAVNGDLDKTKLEEDSVYDALSEREIKEKLKSEALENEGCGEEEFNKLYSTLQSKEEEESKKEKEDNPAALAITAFITSLNEKFSNETLARGPCIEGRKYRNKRVSEGEPSDISNLLDVEHYESTYPYSSSNLTIRKGCGYGYSGFITLHFDVYKVHAYEGTVSAGDYYLVSMSASVANGGMYRGKNRKYKKGLFVRYCGFWGKSFDVAVFPISCVVNKETGEEEYKDLSLENKVVYASSSSYPSPATTIGQTLYTTSSTVGISGGLTGSGGTKEGKSEWGAEVNIAASASWTKTEQRAISDTDIQNKTEGASPRWVLNFNNLPCYRWKSKYGIEEGSSRTYRSTSEIKASWAWYLASDKSEEAKDDSEALPLYLHVVARPTYGSGSFLSTKADWKEDNWTNIGNVDTIIKLKPFVRYKAAKVKFINDSALDIKEVSIYAADKDGGYTVLIYQKQQLLSKNTSESITFPALKITGKKYIVKFIDTNDKTHTYKTYSALPLTNGEIYPIKAGSEFD